MTAETGWVCGYVLEFSDGGPPETVILHRGAREECEKAAAVLPAPMYQGDRPVVSAIMFVAAPPPAEGEQSS